MEQTKHVTSIRWHPKTCCASILHEEVLLFPLSLTLHRRYAKAAVAQWLCPRLQDFNLTSLHWKHKRHLNVLLFFWTFDSPECRLCRCRASKNAAVRRCDLLASRQRPGPAVSCLSVRLPSCDWDVNLIHVYTVLHVSRLAANHTELGPALTPRRNPPLEPIIAGRA